MLFAVMHFLTFSRSTTTSLGARMPRRTRLPLTDNTGMRMSGPMRKDSSGGHY